MELANVTLYPSRKSFLTSHFNYFMNIINRDYIEFHLLPQYTVNTCTMLKVIDVPPTKN